MKVAAIGLFEGSLVCSVAHAGLSSLLTRVYHIVIESKDSESFLKTSIPLSSSLITCVSLKRVNLFESPRRFDFQAYSDCADC